MPDPRSYSAQGSREDKLPDTEGLPMRRRMTRWPQGISVESLQIHKSPSHSPRKIDAWIHRVEGEKRKKDGGVKEVKEGHS